MPTAVVKIGCGEDWCIQEFSGLVCISSEISGDVVKQICVYMAVAVGCLPFYFLRDSLPLNLSPLKLFGLNKLHLIRPAERSFL